MRVDPENTLAYMSQQLPTCSEEEVIMFLESIELQSFPEQPHAFLSALQPRLTDGSWDFCPRQAATVSRGLVAFPQIAERFLATSLANLDSIDFDGLTVVVQAVARGVTVTASDLMLLSHHTSKFLQSKPDFVQTAGMYAAWLSMDSGGDPAHKALLEDIDAYFSALHPLRLSEYQMRSIADCVTGLVGAPDWQLSAAVKVLTAAQKGQPVYDVSLWLDVFDVICAEEELPELAKAPLAMFQRHIRNVPRADPQDALRVLRLHLRHGRSTKALSVPRWVGFQLVKQKHKLLPEQVEEAVLALPALLQDGTEDWLRLMDLGARPEGPAQIMLQGATAESSHLNGVYERNLNLSSNDVVYCHNSAPGLQIVKEDGWVIQEQDKIIAESASLFGNWRTSLGRIFSINVHQSGQKTADIRAPRTKAPTGPSPAAIPRPVEVSSFPSAPIFIDQEPQQFRSLADIEEDLSPEPTTHAVERIDEGTMFLLSKAVKKIAPEPEVVSKFDFSIDDTDFNVERSKKSSSKSAMELRENKLTLEIDRLQAKLERALARIEDLERRPVQPTAAMKSWWEEWMRRGERKRTRHAQPPSHGRKPESEKVARLVKHIDFEAFRQRQEAADLLQRARLIVPVDKTLASPRPGDIHAADPNRPRLNLRK